MVSNGNSQSKTDFIPKRDFIGRKFVETDERNRFFGQKVLFRGRGKMGVFCLVETKLILLCLSTVLSLAVSRALSSLSLSLSSTE
jgi:hypothetical protein